MDYSTKEKLVYRIISGKLIGKLKIGQLSIFGPSPEMLQEAHETYEEFLQIAYLEGMFNQEQLINFLHKNHYWSQDEQMKLDKAPKDVEMLKESLWHNYLKSDTRKSIKARLRKEKISYLSLFNKLHKFDYMTAEGIGNMARSYFLIKKCTKLNGKNIRPEHYDEILSFKARNRIEEETYRELARSEPWRSFWSCGNPFDKASIELTEEQRNLIAFSQMYDNISESPSCPPDEVLKDDDMLDGWLIVQKKEREKNRNSSQIENKFERADTVFLPVETIEDAEKVNMLNSPIAMKIKEQRATRLKQDGRVEHQNFDDQKLRIMLGGNK